MKLSSLKVSLKKKKLLSFQGKFRIWVFFGWNLKKTIAIFEMSTLEILNMQSFMQK